MSPKGIPKNTDGSDPRAGRKLTMTPAAIEQRRKAGTTNGLYVKSENGLQLRHRKVRNLARKVMQALPWLGPSDLPAVRAWAELEILCAYAFADLVTNGITNTKGESRHLLDDYRKLRQTQATWSTQLGMTPSARASLGLKSAKGRALDLAAAMSQEGSHDDDDEA